MKRITMLFSALLIMSFALTSKGDKVTVDEDYLKTEPIAYTADHQVISITIPFYCDKDAAGESLPVFFVEGDPKPDGGFEYKGLYKLVGDQAELILENGRAADGYAVSYNKSLVYLGASDGIYIYDVKLNKTEKYGTLTDSILNIAKENGTDTLYILTDDHSVYKVTEGGNVKTKIENIQNAKKIILDFYNNLYFLGDDNLPYAYSEKGIKSIEGLPAKPKLGDLIKAPFLFKNRVLYISDGTIFFVSPYGSAGSWMYDVNLQISVFNTEATYVQYYSFGNKIYKKVLHNGSFSFLKISNCLYI